MNMKIIHCADLHLDSNMTSNLTSEKARERKRELLLTFHRMIQYAADNGVRAILISGDLFDKKRITKAAFQTVWQAIVEHPHILFFYLPGNHEEDAFLDGQEEQPDNLKVFGSTWTSFRFEGSAGWPVTVSGVRLNRDNAGTVFDSLVLDPDCFNIVMLHGQILEHAAGDKAEIIHIRELKHKGIDYLALGHIHSYREEALDARGFYCYPGCLEGRGFDECGEHGFVRLDIGDTQQSWKRTFVPAAYRRIFSLDIDVTSCAATAEIARRIEEALSRHSYPETSLMKIVLTGEVDVECEKDLDYLLKQFEHRFYFLKIVDETKLHVDYHSFALDASLKGEFVRMVMNDEKLGEEEKADIIRCGIHILAGEEA